MKMAPLSWLKKRFALRPENGCEYLNEHQQQGILDNILIHKNFEKNLYHSSYGHKIYVNTIRSGFPILSNIN